jgi:hypothetical protein
VDGHNLLGHVRKLNIGINLDKRHQHKWHVHRAFAAIVSMQNLKRLVIDLEMECLIYQGYRHEDIYFREPSRESIEGFPKEWPEVRMLAWAEAAKINPDSKVDRPIPVYIPTNRQVERIVRHWMGEADDDHHKFYSAADWEVPA